MEVHGEFPIKGNHEKLNKEFESWWKILNSIGIAGFILFISCLGTGSHKYYCAVLSVVLYFWALLMAQSRFSKTIKGMRNSKRPETREFAEEIIREYVPVIKKPHLFLPFWLGTSSLVILMVFPWLISEPWLYFQPINT